MKDLADEYGFNASYGRRKASKNGWEKGESNDEVTKRVKKRILDEEADKEVKLRKDYDKLIDKLKIALTNEVFESLNRGDTPDFTLLKSFKITTEIIHNLRKEQWEVNEILDVTDKTNINNQGEKLESFVEAVNNMRVKK